MRILYISSEYPPDTGFGGIATYTKHAAEGMAALGHDVHVLCRALEKESHELVNNVVVHRVVCGPHPLPQNRFWYPFRAFARRHISQSLHRLAWASTVSKHCNSLNVSYKFDIIEYPDCGAEGYYLPNTLPLVVRLHTPWTLVCEMNRIKETVADRILQAHIERKSISKARLITSPSKAMAEVLKKRWRIGDVTVYPNPLPLSSHLSVKANTNWIYTGRLEYRKGVHVLVKAYSMICQTHTPPQLLLVGRAYGYGPNGKSYDEYIKQMITENNLQDKIFIIPGVDHKDVPAYLNKSSVAFFPSLWENFPYSCMEAMASGTAVCVADCGGYKEMIQDGKSGVFFKSGDTSSLTQVMRLLLENQSLVARLASGARQQVIEVFDASKICTRVEKLYGALVQ